MKKIYFLLIAILPFFAFSQTNYSGNGNTGFGGTIGQSTLSVSDDGTTISFTLTKGTMDIFSNPLVIYVDNNLGGGFSSTASFSDAQDGLRRGISGFDGTNRSVLSFAADFTPQYALSLSPSENFGGLWELASGGNNSLNFIASVNLTPNTNQAAPSYTFSVTKNNIGITGPISFNFLGTYISTTAFRSNEFIGASFGATNPGQGPATTNSSFAYPSGVLPLSSLNLSGSVINDAAQLSFNTSDETGVSNYIIESSINATVWNQVATLSSKNNVNGSVYSYTDASALKGSVFYRIKAISTDGSFKYSNILNLKLNGGRKINLLGNITTSNLGFSITDQNPSRLSVAVYGSDGRIYSRSTFQHNSGTSNHQIQIADLKPGIYIVRFMGNDGYTTSERFMKK